MTDEAHDNGPKIADAALDASFDAQTKKLEEVTSGVHPEVEAHAKTLDDVFARWLKGFNRDDPKADVRPDPGYVSLSVALSECASRGADPRDVLAQCQCVTRHMHGPPVQLPPTWYGQGRFVVEEQWRDSGARVRERHLSPDNPISYVGVQVYAEDLVSALGGAPPQPEAEAPVAPPPPVPTGAPATPLDAQAPGDYAYGAGPEGYRVIDVGDGFVAAWYGPRRRTPADAVGDAWKHRTRKG